jgi:glutamate dehydrogenase/leucine dehydrogenase
VQNLQGFYWEKKEVNKKLEKMIVGAFERFWGDYRKLKATPRLAAYLIAVRRVVEAERIRGR